MKSKLSPKTIERIADAWYYRQVNGICIGKYQYRISFNPEKREWGIFRANRDVLAWRFNSDEPTPWEWVEALDKKKYPSICNQEIM